jgi:hypothetical protein
LKWACDLGLLPKAQLKHLHCLLLSNDSGNRDHQQGTQCDDQAKSAAEVP